MIDAGRFPVLSLADVLSQEEQEQIRLDVSSCDPYNAVFDGIELTPLIEQSLLWHLRSGTIDRESAVVKKAQQDFVISAALVVRAANRVYEQVDPSIVVLMNGLFFEERIFSDLARARGLRVVTYELGTQKNSLFFSTNDKPAPLLDISDLWSVGAEVSLTSDEEDELDAALATRRTGASMSWQYYPERDVIRAAKDVRRLVLFTNVSWDTAVTGRTLGFASMFDWIEASITHARDTPNLELVIRVHPAESRSPGLETNERVTSSIARAFPVLPSNVRVIAPEDAVDTYSLIDDATAVLVFSSTVGMEAAAAGKPVAVAGKAHYRGRDFTVDVETPEQYATLFQDHSWMVPDPERHARARRYAFLFLCRALMPFTLVRQPTFGDPVLAYSRLDELVPGRDEVLDLICRGVLEGSPIRLPFTTDGRERSQRRDRKHTTPASQQELGRKGA